MLGLGVVVLGVLVYFALGARMKQAQGDTGECMAAKAVADLAQRLSIGQGEIKVVDVKEVTWPDTSLGSPEPGMFYAQVLTPGYKIILQAKGQEYEYHTDRTRIVKLHSQVGTGKQAAEGPRLAYLKEPVKPDPNLNQELWLRNLKDGKEVLIASGVSEFYFSPNGEKLALISRGSRSGLELSFANGDGSDRKPFWTAVAISDFVWAPDGEHFALLSRETLEHYDLGVVIGSLSGPPPSGPVYLPAGEKMVRGELGWDSGSSTLILNAYSDGGKADVWAITPEEPQPKLLLRNCGSPKLL